MVHPLARTENKSSNEGRVFEIKILRLQHGIVEVSRPVESFKTRPFFSLKDNVHTTGVENGIQKQGGKVIRVKGIVRVFPL